MLLSSTLLRMHTFMFFYACGNNLVLEIVFTIAASAFDILFIGCVLNTKIAYTTAEKLTFEAFY